MGLQSDSPPGLYPQWDSNLSPTQITVFNFGIQDYLLIGFVPGEDEFFC